MLSIETINEAISSTVVLDQREIYLSPESGSPLERLVSLSSVVTTLDKETEYTPNAELISQCSYKAPDEHADELEKFADDISVYVQNHLNFAKNVVKPVIELVVERVKTTWDTLSNVVPNLKIIKHDLPEVTKVAAFKDMVDDYKDVNYIPYNVNIRSDLDLSASEIIELIKTGNADIDESVAIFNTRVGDDFIVSVFDSIFKFTDRSIQQRIDDKKEGNDVATLVFLITNKLYDNPIEGIKLDLPTFNDTMDMLRKQAAYRLLNSYSKMNRDYKTKMMIIEYNSSSITVNELVYNEWIESGGSDNILFGNVCHTSPKLYVEEINEFKQEFIDRWTQECNVIITRNNARSFSLRREALHSSILNTVQENMELCYQHLLPEGVHVSVSIPEYITFLAKLDKEINNLRESDMINVWALVTDIVCDTIFYYTASKDILKGVEEAMRINKELNIREALLLSTIDYVIDYVANQIVK